jgi:hypothetical protein
VITAFGVSDATYSATHDSSSKLLTTATTELYTPGLGSLPAGNYTYLLYMSANGSSGHTASIDCGSSITYTPTPSPTPSPSPGTSGGGGGGGGGLSGFN